MKNEWLAFVSADVVDMTHFIFSTAR